jgi:hypothetical protein
MRQLSKTETFILLIGGLLMVIGAGGSMFLQSWAAYIFAPGALMFAAMQMRQSYDGNNFTIRRLRRILLTSDVFFLLAGLLMLANQSNFFGISQLIYIKYVHNNWIVVLLVAAILQLYASHRIANELEKEAKKR